MDSVLVLTAAILRFNFTCVCASAMNNSKMIKTFAVVAAVACQAADALATTKLDVKTLYGGVQLAQTSSTSQVEAQGFPVGTKADPLCLMQVHSVRPNLDVPKLPPVSYTQSGKELPPALRRRLQRRYEQRGLQVPDYLRDAAPEEPPALAAAQPEKVAAPAPRREPPRLPEPTRAAPEPIQRIEKAYRAASEPARVIPGAPAPYERQHVAPPAPPAPKPQPQPKPAMLSPSRHENKRALASLVTDTISHQAERDLAA